MKCFAPHVLAVALSASCAQAASISDFDLSQLVFDVQTEAVTGPNEGRYTGRSGLTGSTIGFSILA
jgi:hypothetical protein